MVISTDLVSKLFHKIDETNGFAMRLISFAVLAMLLAAFTARAQSVSDNLPPAISDTAPETVPQASNPPSPNAASPTATPAPVAVDPYTVTDVAADVTADSAAHARDQALIQAERAAFTQLCARLNAPESLAKLNDDGVAALVQSFDVQSEKLSAVRYIGVFTIRFKASALAKKLGHAAAAPNPVTATTTPADNTMNAVPDAATLASAGHLVVAVPSPSLAAFTQTKKRIASLARVLAIETLDLGRGISHIDLRYVGTVDDLKSALAGQGYTLHIGGENGSELIDNRVLW